MEINFCPFCDSPSHKLVLLTEKLFYCKQCDKFFNLTEEKLRCMKCNSENVKISDFPAPDGSLVFQCEKCKKMFGTENLLEHNDIEAKK